ncbi:hypothetical protein FD37_GL000528 [Levilactobacillus spicheri DSM 15429]|uniref:Uncharacterized protein n=1 Tax=Levilactobacillus spicheri DSM 15429 TaxID=1423805 RepID=A0A0R1QY10_9LACO|nr:hypothetical protein FD37_GL000528 [Levilactobacillus spicheri DSM 15429]
MQLEHLIFWIKFVGGSWTSVNARGTAISPVGALVPKQNGPREHRLEARQAITQHQFDRVYGFLFGG